MINNISKIREFLKFDNPNEFYYITVMQRKKDNNPTISSHDGARRIRTFSVYSLEEFDRFIPFIINICDTLNARAYIDLQRRDNVKVQLICIKKLVENIENGGKKTRGMYDAAVAVSPSGDKLWTIDYDSKDLTVDLYSILKEHGAEIYLWLPTVNGSHYITGKFDLRWFPQIDNVEIKKQALTLLYYNNDLLSKSE